MTYHGVVLLLAGWQADEPKLVEQYTAIVDKSVTALVRVCAGLTSRALGSRRATRPARCGS
jgi:hypothetical protein